MKILLVDDKDTIRSAMKDILLKLGFKDITEADDGKDAWEKITAGIVRKKPIKFDLIVSDMEMPKMTGLELLRKVRNSSDFKNICFVMASTVTSKSIILETMNLGIQAYILKPFDESSVKLKLIQAGVL